VPADLQSTRNNVVSDGSTRIPSTATVDDEAEAVDVAAAAVGAPRAVLDLGQGPLVREECNVGIMRVWVLMFVETGWNTNLLDLYPSGDERVEWKHPYTPKISSLSGTNGLSAPCSADRQIIKYASP
jgi:hypothetical protein